ncbi:uncharacterized protein VP01_4603g1 [Puccinia sorghi]|uniref:Uncharacterized protein n=1 Tax=Puccinia sorghi TaxID=27349 RepID=A0A0L6UQG3_9BASI|nr:uncharacterized protein VP01_4603g1 [Puccinia sorghi]
MINLGHHTGKIFSKMFYNVLNGHQCLKKLHKITSNNVSTKSMMALELQTMIPSFNMKEKLLVFISHVINLHCKKNSLNCLHLTCSMLQPSFHSNSTCLNM